jgi:protoporphyrinogen oxidase
MDKHINNSVIIIGAGPAGLTAAYLLAKENIPVTVLEADPHYVGGIARTVTWQGYCFDIGGHRFFSKSQEVEDFWTEILPDDMLARPRSSRIFYRDKFFSYPLNISEVLSKLGIVESALCFFSYLKARLRPFKQPKNFTEWVSNQFGGRMYKIFFKTYTEKVWGMRCEEISADWAAQRIKGLSLWSAIVTAIMPRKKNQPVIKTLIDTFRYPRKGPGMLWDACVTKIRAMGGVVLLDHPVTRCEFVNNQWCVEAKGQKFCGRHLISSAALRELTCDYLPAASPLAKLAAQKLKYRDFLIVVLILKDNNPFHDNWIYIHDPAVDVARIQNFKSWSPEMVPVAGTCCYGMEYFCFDSDGLWLMSDEDLIAKATRELIHIGLTVPEDILKGCVVRQPKAYPVYDDNYKQNVSIIQQSLAEHYPTLHLVGRNGMHKYNNQDHAMMTAMLTVKNILAGSAVYDVWQVNQDAEYHESGSAGGLRSVPEKITP